MEFEKQFGDDVMVRNLIYFDCPQEELLRRMTKRAETSGRSDDNPETMKKRLETFEQETIPVVRTFEARNNCIKVDANRAIEPIYEDLKGQLDAANVYPPAPVEVLFVLGGPGSGKGT